MEAELLDAGPPHESSPFQFSLRTLLTIVAAAAGMFAIWSRTSTVEAAGCAVCGLAIWAALRSRFLARLGLLARLLVLAIGLTGLWFVAVEESVYVDSCPDCFYAAYVVQYKVVGVVVSEKTYKNSQSLIEQAASCLGVPCSHPHVDRWQKYRYWGLLICGWPCLNGTLGLVGDQSPEFVKALGHALRRLEKQNPNLAAEFKERVLEKHDLVYWRQLLQLVQADPAMQRYENAAHNSEWRGRARRQAKQFMPPRPWRPGDDCRMVAAAGLLGRVAATDNAAMDEEPKRKRRWFQFSLRTLMFFIFICAIPCAWLGRKIEQKLKEREIVAAILKLKGKVYYEYQIDSKYFEIPAAEPTGPSFLRKLLGDDFFTDVQAVSLFRSTDADEGLRLTKQLARVQAISVEKSSASDDGLINLRNMSQLKELVLRAPAVTDASLGTLKCLVGLRVLDLSGTKISDAGASDLKKALPNCAVLH